MRTAEWLRESQAALPISYSLRGAGRQAGESLRDGGAEGLGTESLQRRCRKHKRCTAVNPVLTASTAGLSRSSPCL